MPYLTPPDLTSVLALLYICFKDSLCIRPEHEHCKMAAFGDTVVWDFWNAKCRLCHPVNILSAMKW